MGMVTRADYDTEARSSFSVAFSPSVLAKMD